MDVEQRLRTALRDGVRNMDLHGPGPEDARRRARRHARRRTAIPAAFVAATVGTTTAVVWARDREPSQQVLLDQGSATEPSGTVAPLAFEWRATDATVVQYDDIFVASTGVYYALATAPGTHVKDYPMSDAPRAIYRSNDGTTWKASAPIEDSWISSLRERDGVLYAIGTAPAANGEIETSVGISTDGGDEFDRVTLPTEATPPDAAVDLQLSNVLPKLAVGPEGMVASVRTSWWFDPDTLLTPDERAQAMVAVISDAGVEVYSESEVLAYEARRSAGSWAFEGCISRAPAPDPESSAERDAAARCAKPELVRTISWAELGLNGMDDLAVDEWFVSTNGTDWERIDAPYASTFATTQLTWTPHGFVASGAKWSNDGTVESRLVRSVDGRTWEPVSVGGEPLAYVGAIGSRLVAVRQGPAQVLTSDDAGATWNPVDLRALMGTATKDAYVSAFDAGPLGVALAYTAVDEAGNESALLTSVDGAHWTVTPLADIAAQAGTRTPQSIDWVTVGPDNIVFTATTWGTEEAKQSSQTYVGTPLR